MSEVYIRSQNKEKLYRLGGNYACVEYGEYEDVKKKRGGAEADKKRHVICISDGCLEGGMDVQPFAAVIPRLYEMPEK